jgi:hypothetical protein
MTASLAKSQPARPWYISLTAIWHEAKNFKSLRTFIRKSRLYSKKAGNHVLIPQDSWHFTVLAIIRINGHPPGTQDMRAFAGRVFQSIRSNSSLIERLRSAFVRFRFVASAYEVRCYDRSLALQFECDEALGTLRDEARDILGVPVFRLIRLHTISEVGRRFISEFGVPLIESILDDPNKNYGSKAFGSIARSPCQSGSDAKRWCEKFAEVPLKFEKIHLLISDEMLTNPRTPEKEDVPI